MTPETRELFDRLCSEPGFSEDDMNLDEQILYTEQCIRQSEDEIEALKTSIRHDENHLNWLYAQKAKQEQTNEPE